MDLSESNGLQKRNGDPIDPQQLIPQFGAPIGMVPGTSTGTSSPFPLWPGMPNLSAPMVEPFNSSLLNQSSNKFPFPAMIPPNGLPNFPAEPGFIERAARLSCFSTNGGFTSLMNSSILNQTQKGEMNSLSIGAGSSHGNLEKNNEIFNEEKNSKDENQNTNGDSSQNDTGGKKRKRINQDQSMENTEGNNERSPDETANQNNSEGKKEAENKNNGKNNSNNNKEGSDSKGDYIHVRARRGQATNSHSLAERVRREKISERMKYLQELVPGCSKVTGKAVMLDEIINYVQSLQRQVEFLSMKLAAVNPRLDLNIESLLSKDILQGRVGCSSAVGGFTPEMFHAQLSNPGFGIPGLLNPSDPFRRPINASQLSSINPFKDPATNPQMGNAWQDELHNVMSMNFNPNQPMSSQEVNAKPGDGFQI
ncbi:hypothetical protein LUZ60_017103 [Juncus effusus]|nr:hypothetical protein LUZ60_017103 [Juncus effusus]